MTIGRLGASGLLVVVAGWLSGCGGGDARSDPGCPRISVVSDLSRATYFRDGPGRDITDVTAEADLELRDMKCVFGRSQVDLTFHVVVAVAPGPGDRARQRDVDYFVAVMAPEGNLTAKETFRVRADFGENRSRKVYDEEIAPRIPVADKAHAAAHQILIGFQLTPEQVEWNLRRRRDR